MIRPPDTGPTWTELSAIPVETLREFIRDKMSERSIRRVADEIGIGRSTLNKVVLGRTVPQPRVRRAFALWYLRETGGVQVYADACNALLAGFPAQMREQAGPLLLDSLRTLYASLGVEPPRWIGLLKA